MTRVMPYCPKHSALCDMVLFRASQGEKRKTTVEP